MQWCNIGSNIPSRDDFGLGLNRNLKGFERYRMSGSDEEGDYTLDIDSVTLEDDAKFQCQVLKILHHHHQLTPLILSLTHSQGKSMTNPILRWGQRREVWNQSDPDILSSQLLVG